MQHVQCKIWRKKIENWNYSNGADRIQHYIKWLTKDRRNTLKTFFFLKYAICKSFRWNVPQLVYLFISWHTWSSLSKNSIINVASVEVVPRKILTDVKTTIAVLGTSKNLVNGYIKGAIAKLCKQKKPLYSNMRIERQIENLHII